MKTYYYFATLGALALLSLENAAAQSPRRTTVGRLLGGVVDTIEVENRLGGELRSRSASLRLVRVDSGYSGTLRMGVYVAGSGPVMAGSPTPARSCDTTMTATMTPPDAQRLLALVRRAVIEPGDAPGVPRPSDVWYVDSYRLTSGSNVVIVRDARTVLFGDSLYRAPLRPGPRDPKQPPWAALDQTSSLMELHRMLQPYLQLDLLNAFAGAC
ncbi:MAG TPA: hypothetical protein VF461_17940, partial [Gemmatimonadaceae bacterium]